MYEHCFDDRQWSVEEDAQLEAIAAVKSTGKAPGPGFWCYVDGSSGSLTGSLATAVRLYYYASFLLTYDPNYSVYQVAFTTPSGFSVFPETGFVPTGPASTPSSVTSLLSSTGAYVQEYSACYYRGSLIGRCEIAVNPGTSTVSIPNPYGLSHSMALSGGGVLDGGSASFTGGKPTYLGAASAAILVPSLIASEERKMGRPVQGRPISRGYNGAVRLSPSLARDIIEWDVENWGRALHFWERAVSGGSQLTCLELGARRGGLSLWLALQGHRVVCSDIKDTRTSAEPLHAAYAMQDRVTYAAIDATAIPYENHFDVIAFKSMLGGVAWDGDIGRQAAAMRSIHHALRPGGVLLFAENLSGTPLHSTLRRRFIKWNNVWRYVTVEEMQHFMAPYSQTRMADDRRHRPAWPLVRNIGDTRKAGRRSARSVRTAGLPLYHVRNRSKVMHARRLGAQ